MWIRAQIPDQHNNLSTDMAIQAAREFLKQMAQPWSKEEQLGHSLWYEQPRRIVSLQLL